MPAVVRETDEQRRRRVASRIRNEMRAHLSGALLQLARLERLPDRWMNSGTIDRLLDEEGYWSNHPDPLAAFLGSGTRQEMISKALDALCCTHPDAWLRSGEQFRPFYRDWNLYACEKANLLRREHPDAERTAWHTGSDGTSVLFAHDNYAGDERARTEVTQLRKNLREAGIPERGFGLSDDGHTWVLVVYSQDEALLGKALFDAWQTAFNAPIAF